jgi:cellulose biosynthesis protein BcsQ
MKKLHFIIQAKGGVGKSLLMYLFALKHHKRSECLFVDLDASTHTAKRQLTFVDQEQFDSVSLMDEKGLLVRDNLINYLQSASESEFEEIYFDFGAPESEQLPSLMEYDIPFKTFAELLDYEVTFHVVIGGGGAYNASVEYLLKCLTWLRPTLRS